MRARLGPQEPRRPRPPVATTWGAHPDPMVTPLVQNVPPHQAVRQAGRNLPNEPPSGSISKRLDDMLSMPFCSHIIHYDPPKGFLVPKFSTYDGVQRPLRPYHALSTTHDSRYRKRRAAMQSVPRQPTRAGPLMVSPPTS
ncbi:hypothetical protein CK203_030443 [Vitis vinifera]|uniref:Uncharacterized protein n=1 Tax=Vitis vinifera TaxID=29760 RepID=A0A438JDI5_VITVI|nr:hypothetical protein CK203_030443 [Vitis vinifera]